MPIEGNGSNIGSVELNGSPVEGEITANGNTVWSSGPQLTGEILYDEGEGEGDWEGWADNDTSFNHTYEKNSDHLYLYSAESGDVGFITVGTNYLTDYNELQIDLEHYIRAQGSAPIHIYDSSDEQTEVDTIYGDPDGRIDRTILTFDISSYTGYQEIEFVATGGTHYQAITELWIYGVALN